VKAAVHLAAAFMFVILVRGKVRRPDIYYPV
jgi:hypothetical protein